jgi:hypothetical protein
MTITLKTPTRSNTPEPIGPCRHVAMAGHLITIGGTAGVDP